MNFLDIRTVMFSQLITDAACTAIMAFLWLQNRKRYTGMFFWVLDFVFQTMAVLLIMLRGSLPDWMSMGLSNTLVIAGALMGYWGLERFVGKRSSQVHNYILLAVFIFIHFYFIYIQPDLEARNLNVSLGLLIVCFQCAWLMLRRVGSGLTRMTRVVGWVFAFFCLVSLMRIFTLLAIPEPSNDFFQSGFYDALLLMAYQVLLIMLAFGLALMVNRKLLVEVKTQEEKFIKAFHSSPYAILITRLSDGLILDVNRGFEEIAGYAPAEAVGKTSLDLGLWVKETDRQEAVAELSARGEVHGREFQFRAKSGRELTGLFFAEILVLENERLVMSSISDISERKQAEVKLIASEIRYRRLFEAARDGILILDAETGMIVDVNPFLVEMLGFSAEEFRGKKIWELGFFKDILANEANFLELQQKEYIRYEDLPLETADGRRIEVEFVSNVYQVDHHKVIQCNIRDISERKRTEEALEQQTQELARSNTELEQFAYVASHDLQEPLRMVSSYVQLLERRYKGRLDKDADEFISFAVDGAGRMQRLINDLLVYSRVGRHGQPFVPVSCEKALDQALDNLQAAILDNKAKVTHDPLPPSGVLADEIQLVQLFQNLISNGIKFHGEKRPHVHVSVALSPLPKSGEGTGGEGWLFSVRDNGIGIDPQYAERIFIIFQRLHDRSQYPGTGIGLAVCKKIVQRHGGSIWVESEPGKGATFFFTLPKAGGTQA